MRLLRNVTIGALLALAVPLQGAHAFTECTTTVTRIFSGDDGMVWFIFGNGGHTWIAGSDPDRETTVALAMTALVSGRQVIVRYLPDGVACNSGQPNLNGFWLA